MNIYLIGYRGTGKTSVAPKVAQLLGEPWTALDLDASLEERAELTIADIFAQEGEQSFRDREQAELEFADQRRQCVVATGGGVIGREANRKLLKKGWIVWLTASPETILDRLNADQTTRQRRPKLTQQGDLAEIQELLKARTPVYSELADLQLSTESDTPQTLAELIATQWRSHVTARGLEV